MRFFSIEFKFVLTALSLFLLDILSLSFFEKPFFYFLLTFYILLLHKKNLPIYIIFLCAFLISCQASVLYHAFAAQFIFLGVVALITLKAKELLYQTFAQSVLILSCCLVAQQLIVQGARTIFTPYTAAQICANILVESALYLVMFRQGKLGNRLRGLNLQEESPDS